MLFLILKRLKFEKNLNHITPWLLNPQTSIQDLQYFGEFGGVNPSVSDATTFTFVSAKTMSDTFEGNTEGCHLYARHTTPSNLYLSEALRRSGRYRNCQCVWFWNGCHYSSTSCSSVVLAIMWCRVVRFMVEPMPFLKNFAPKLNIQTSFVDITKLDRVEAAITSQTKVLYCESVSNPLLEVADIAALATSR